MQFLVRYPWFDRKASAKSLQTPGGQYFGSDPHSSVNHRARMHSSVPEDLALTSGSNPPRTIKSGKLPSEKSHRQEHKDLNITTFNAIYQTHRNSPQRKPSGNMLPHISINVLPQEVDGTSQDTQLSPAQVPGIVHMPVGGSIIR